jgi:hypothetical protein
MGFKVTAKREKVDKICREANLRAPQRKLSNAMTDETFTEEVMGDSKKCLSHLANF